MDLISELASAAGLLQRFGYKHSAGFVIQAIDRIKPPECAPMGADVGSQAALDVLAERRRQVEAEGWTPEHDDAHDAGSLARAASCYAERAALASQCVAHGAHGAGEVDGEVKHQIPANWPWNGNWWKFGDRRRALVKAGALILAEIERLDRASMREGAR